MSMWLLRVRLLGRGCGCGWAVGVAVAVAAVAAVAACRTVTVAATAAAWLRLLSWGCRSVDVAVRIELSSNLPQKICKIVEFRAGNESFSFRKMDSDTSVKNLVCIMGVEGIVWGPDWGNMCVLTMGSLQVFMKAMTLISVSQVKLHVFPKT
jgi:hypothetical protein